MDQPLKIKIDQSPVLQLLNKEQLDDVKNRFEQAAPKNQKVFLAVADRLDQNYVRESNKSMTYLIKKAKLLLDRYKK